jgi:hypothetical protein
MCQYSQHLDPEAPRSSRRQTDFIGDGHSHQEQQRGCPTPKDVHAFNVGGKVYLRLVKGQQRDPDSVTSPSTNQRQAHQLEFVISYCGMMAEGGLLTLFRTQHKDMMIAARLVNVAKGETLSEEETISVMTTANMSWHTFMGFCAVMRSLRHGKLFAPFTKVRALAEDKNTPFEHHQVSSVYTGNKKNRTQDCKGNILALCSWELGGEIGML